jgi:hypothetical protein
VEHLAYEAAKKISLPEILLNSGFSPKQVNVSAKIKGTSKKRKKGASRSLAQSWVIV